MAVGTAVGTAAVEVKRLDITLLKPTADLAIGGLTFLSRRLSNPTHPEGVYVGDVFPERLTYDPDRYLSEASARFNVGDRVLAMNGQPVSDVLMATGLARSFPAGPVTITVEREAELEAVLQRTGGQPDLLLAQARARVLLQRSLLEGPRAMLLRNGSGNGSGSLRASGAISVLAGHRTWFLGVVDSCDARVLHDALAVYYAQHEPSRVATVSTLIARVYGGPPCSINGIMVSRVLWTAKELCEQIQAKHGERVPVTFKPDGSLDISEEQERLYSELARRRLRAGQAQETQLDPEWIVAREASLVEAQRMAEQENAYQEELERALALSRAQHLQAGHNGAWLGLDVQAPLSHLDSVSLMQAAQRGDAAAVSRLMRQQIQQDAGRPVPLFEPDDVRSCASLQQRVAP